jgi:PadR family transcriptional regulator AphA
MKKLTTTSYAILGLLAIRPWSTYELTQQVRQSLSNWWPRTERQLYEQPKILVEHGFATATKETVGRRPRTMYDITPAGRDALRAWLEQPSTLYNLEWDAVLRIFFAEHGTKEQLLATLDNTATRLHAEIRDYVPELERVNAPDYQYAERAHLFALILKLETDVYTAVGEWFEWAANEVAAWPDINGPADRLAFFNATLEEYRAAFAIPSGRQRTVRQQP